MICRLRAAVEVGRCGSSPACVWFVVDKEAREDSPSAGGVPLLVAASRPRRWQRTSPSLGEEDILVAVVVPSRWMSRRHWRRLRGRDWEPRWRGLWMRLGACWI